MGTRIELSLEFNDDSTRDMEVQSSSWIREELAETFGDYAAIDIPDEDQGETEVDDEITNPDTNQGEKEMEDEPLNPGENHGDTSNGESNIPNRNGSDHGERHYLTSSKSILRVPKHIHEVDEKCFTPRLVSIGPFHHKNPSLQVMENHKLRLLNKLLEKNYCILETMRSAMRDIQPRARRYYSESFTDLSTDDFVEMMVVDGCFIVQLFRLIRTMLKENRQIDDPIFSNRWMLPNICCDILMLENQLPFIVLEELHNLTRSPEETSLNKLALQCFRFLSLGRYLVTFKMSKLQGPQKHLLALFQSVYAPGDSRTKSTRLREKQARRINQTFKNLKLHPSGKNWVKNATTLKSFGIKFRSSLTGNLLDIKFRGSTLEIPTLAINQNNTIIMKNMLAYEQCTVDAKPYMTSLIMFLCSIGVVPEDIKLLREAAILQHQPGDDQMVVDSLQLLCREIECGIDESVIFDQVVSINRYCQSWPRRFLRYFVCESGPRVLGGGIAVIVIYIIKLWTFSSTRC